MEVHDIAVAIMPDPRQLSWPLQPCVTVQDLTPADADCPYRHAAEVLFVLPISAAGKLFYHSFHGGKMPQPASTRQAGSLIPGWFEQDGIRAFVAYSAVKP